MSTRKIKDAKDLSTNELIYFKGHAQATYMSDGRTVEEAITTSSGGSSSSGSPDPSITYFDVYSLDNMEGVDDYNNIEANGTILQEDYDAYCSAIEKNKFGITFDSYYLHNICLDEAASSFFDVYSVFYDYMTDKLKYIRVTFLTNLHVSVETRIIESNNSSGDSSGSGGSVDMSKYATKSELAAKQDVISDIDTIRSNASNYKGTVTSVKINNVSKSPSSGVVDLGYINKQLSTTTSSSMTLSPNVYYRNTSTSLSTLTITLGSVSNSNIINEYFVEFTTRSSGTTVSLPSSVKWANGEAPTFENGKTYQISIVNNLGVCTKFG